MGRAQQLPEQEPVSDAALRQFVGYNMKRAFNVLQADLAEALEPFGLRMLTYSALALIADNPGLRPSQLAATLSVERANVVIYVDQLEQAGWITRSPCPEDRRAHALTCTRAGQQLYKRAQAAVRAHDRRMLDGMRAVEVTTMKKALAIMERSGA